MPEILSQLAQDPAPHEPIAMDRAELERYGRMLDDHPPDLHGDSVAMSLAHRFLRVRTRDGANAPLRANAVQCAFEQRRSQRNIVLKARQMGLTTWVAARFFLRTITRPGTLTLQVAHTQEAAEEIFRIVHRFLDCLPEPLRAGPLKTSRANVRQLAFPEFDSEYRVVTAGDRNAGRGLTVQNLHCSELARWPGDPAETLAGLRAALAPSGELILESTPEGVGGCFHEEWQKASETGMIRHFFPWWMEPRYRAEPVNASSLASDERDLAAREHLDLAQIGFRRQIRSSFRGLARQEYAEDADSCFLLSGDSIFELDAINARLADLIDPAEQRRNGELEIWLPPLDGKRYLVAVDPAGGGSEGDYSAAQVIEMESGLQCAEFAAHVGGLELAQLVTALASEYNCAHLVIERNNHGTAILSLADVHCRYPRIYRQAGQAGWLTNSVTRPAALGRLAQGTDADLRLAWQEFLIRMIANAFGLPPLLLGLEADVNRSTAAELADEAFRGAISPLAHLLAGHITRDLFAKCIGWREFEFVFNDLNARDEDTELAVQVQLLQAGVLTIDEVRAMRGLAPLTRTGTAQLTGQASTTPNDTPGLDRPNES